MTVLPVEGRPAERLNSDPIAWLTTISPAGVPQSSPVGFVVHNGAIFVRSKPAYAKLHNIRLHPAVSVHLDSDGSGGDIVIVEGTADVVEPASHGVLDAYLAKYDLLIRERMGTDPETFAAQFSVTIRVTPRRVRAW